MILSPEALAQAWRQNRGNPLLGFTPQALTGWLGMWKRGQLRPFALYYRELEEGADLTISAVAPKRRAGVASRPVVIEKLNDSAEASLHQEALQYFYDNLTVKDCTNLDVQGKVKRLVRNMANMFFLSLDAHEMVWEPNGPDLTATFWHCPVEMLASNKGRAQFAGPFGLLGQEDCRPGEWLVACSDLCLAKPLALASVFKSYTYKDWLNYNLNYSEPQTWGTTTAGAKTEEYKHAADTLAALGPGSRAMFGDGVDLKSLVLGTDGAGIFKPLADEMKQAQITLIMGSNLATSSEKDHVGASLQGEDKEILVLDDLEAVSEAANIGIDVHVIEAVFGRGVKPLAKFTLVPPVTKNDDAVIKRHEHLREFGVPLSIGQVAEELSHELPKPGVDLVKPKAAAAPLPALMGTANEAGPTPDLRSRDGEEGSAIQPPQLPASIRAAQVRALQPLSQAITNALHGLGDGGQAHVQWGEAMEQMFNQADELESTMAWQQMIQVLVQLGLNETDAAALLEDAARPVGTPEMQNGQ